jgi:hypothetical protein
MGNLAVTYHSFRQFKEAEELGLVVVEKRERIFGEDHSQTVRAMSNLAQTYNESTGESPRTWYCGDEKAHTTLGTTSLIHLWL